MSAAKMFSSFLGFSSASSTTGSADNDSGSVTSDYTVQDNPGELRKRGSLTSTISKTLSSDISEDEIDSVIRCLYGDTDILEKKCQLSATGKSFSEIDSLASPTSLSGSGLRKDSNGDRYTNTGNGIGDDTSHLPMSIESIDDEYYRPQFDPVEGILEEVSEWDPSERSQRFMAKMETVDASKDIVVEELYSTIETNYEDLMRCMHIIHSVDIEISKANIQMSVGRRKIKQASEMLSVGPIKIAAFKNKRDKLLMVADTVRSLKFIKDLHREMLKNIVTGDLGRAAEFAHKALSGMLASNSNNYSSSSSTSSSSSSSDRQRQNNSNNNLDRFSALHGTTESVRKHLCVIRQKADKALMRLCCRKFAAGEYSNIVKAYLVLDDLARSGETSFDPSLSAKDQISEDSDELLIHDRQGGLDGLASRIQRFQLADIDSCLHTAILEFIYASQHKKQQVAAEVGGYGGVMMAASVMNAADMMDLAEVPLDVLYSLIKPELAAPCVLRSCELFADVVHTHYLVTQWHRTPFDDRNDSLDFLHRCSPGASGYTHSAVGLVGVDEGVKANLSVVDDLQQSQLTAVYHALCRSRSALWAELSSALVDMLNRISGFSKLPFEDYLAVKWAVKAMASLGHEFCGSESATNNALQRCIDEKTREFFSGFHAESFHMLRQMTDEEAWNNVPLRVSDYGGIFGLLKTKLTTFKANSKMVDLIFKAEIAGVANLGLSAIVARCHGGSVTTWTGAESGTANSLLVNFAKSGNPFHFMTQAEELMEAADGHPDSNRSDNNGDERNNGSISNNTNVKQADFGISAGDIKDSGTFANPNEIANLQVKPSVVIQDMNDYIAVLLCEDTSTPKSRRALEANETLVVTQTALNGLTRYAGKYLQMMHVMPDMAPDIFQGMEQLFDYYLCYVFNAFVPVEEKVKFLAKASKMSLPAPDQCKDFGDLLCYLDLVMNDSQDRSMASNSTSALTSVSSSDSVHGSDHSGRPVSINANLSHILDVNNNRRFSALLKEPDAIDLSDSKTFYGLNSRIIAAESCWFAAKILAEMKGKLALVLTEPSSPLAACVSRYQIVSSQLRSLIYKTICPQLIKQSWICTQITDNSGLDSKKLRDTHHDWIGKLIVSFSEIWAYLSTSEFSDALAVVREQVWMELCQAAFDAILEGFCKVRKCTAEGRAAMLMNIAALHDGLDTIHTCRTVPRGKSYVTHLIIASGMSDEDMMLWVNENWQAYAYRHVYGLLTQCLSSVLNSKKLKDAVAVIDTLYEDVNANTVRPTTASENAFATFIPKSMRRQSVF